MLRRTYLFLLLCAFSTPPILSQTHESDSLRQRIREAPNDSVRWLRMFDLVQYFAKNDLDSAIQVALRSLEFSEKRVPYGLSQSLNNVGLQYMNKGEFDKATTYFFQALKEGEKRDCRLCQATTLGNIGLIFWKKKEIDKAEAYMNDALKEHRTLADTLGAIRTLNNLGLLHTESGKLDKAEAVYREAIGLLEQKQSTSTLDFLLNNLANINYRKGDFRAALDFYGQSLAVAEKTGNGAGRYLATLNSGWAQFAMKNYSQAIQLFDRAERLARELKSEEYLAEAYSSKMGLYKETGDYKNALDNLEKYINIRDSLDARLNSRNIAELETKYQTQQKETRLVRQQLELESQASQKKAILLGAIAFILVLAAVFQYFRILLRSRRKEAEIKARLEHAEAQNLRELNRVKSTFFANISHEFRTPLTLILSPLEQMMGGGFSGDLQKYYRIMHRSGRRLLELVNQLLDLSKLESGKLQLQASEGDLGRFVRAVAGSFDSLATQQQTDFRVEVPDAPLLCHFDRDKLEKIAVNLISNAFKFTPADGNGRITVSLRGEGQTAVLQVRDNGIGIPAAQMDHLFDRFYYSTASELQPGSGLGLALTKELAELHGGGIGVESREGEGAVFTARFATGKAFFKAHEIVAGFVPDTLQQEKVKDFPTQERAEQRSATAALTPGVKPQVLLAEDNPDVRAYIKEQLQDKYHITEAENGRLGLERAIEQVPDLVITDIMMPEMDGTEFCKRLKTNEKTSHIPVVMLTARAEQSDKLKGLETGADDYLVKPFDARELHARIANLIEQRRRLHDHFRRSLTAFAASAVEAESMDAAFLRRVREAVEAGYEDETFSVVELGAQIGMSRSQLHRKLSALTGFSPNEIIRNMRLERAKAFLEKNAGTASEIAYRCGFTSPAYFAKCFKDYFGVTPGEVQR